MDIDESLRNLKALGERLVPYNYPMSPPHVEDEVNLFKSIEAYVDGYKLQIHYNKADYGTYKLVTFQIMGANAPFLPFNVVFKVARKALGTDNLSLIEIYKDKRKIYCWTLMEDNEGELKPYPYQEEEEVEHLEYEGYEYTYMNPNQVRYY